MQAALALGERNPEVGVLVLSQYVESMHAMRLLEHGGAGRGYLLKDRVSDLESFAGAIRRVGDGGSVVAVAVLLIGGIAAHVAKLTTGVRGCG